MKFRIKTSDIGSIQHFTYILQGVSYLSKNFVLRITETQMFFIINERGSPGNGVYWCQLNYTSLFNECLMEGLTDQNNEIILEIVSAYLLKCFRQTSFRSLRMKLMKNRIDNPCFSIEIEQSTYNANTRFITHEVPVRLVPSRLWGDYIVQPKPEFDVSIYLPNLKMLRTILDKMKNLCSILKITANDESELLLEITNDRVKVRTQFSNLGRPIWRTLGKSTANVSNFGVDSETSKRSKSMAGRAECKSASVTVDIRALYQFINSIKVNPDKLVCNVVNEKCIQIHVSLQTGSMLSIIPGTIR